MRLVDADRILEDCAFNPDEKDETIPKGIKKFYRESIEDETCGVTETIHVALVSKTGGKYKILKVLE